VRRERDVSIYRGMVTLTSALLVVLGAAMLLVTVTHGFGVGVVLGVLFVAAGAGRLLMLRRSR